MRLFRAFLVPLLLTAPVFADKGGHPHNKDRNDEQGEHDREGYRRGQYDQGNYDRRGEREREGYRRGQSARGTFDPRDRDVIYGYYRNSNNLPPGLAKRNGNLPPGLQKHLQRSGRLPPGLEKRMSPFPNDIERRLPPLPSGYTRGIIDDQAVIYDPRTRMIMDAISIGLGSRR